MALTGTMRHRPVSQLVNAADADGLGDAGGAEADGTTGAELAASAGFPVARGFAAGVLAQDETAAITLAKIAARTSDRAVSGRRIIGLLEG